MVKEVARGPCALTAWKNGKALANETSPSTFRFMQAQESISRLKNIMLEVECGAD